MVFVIRLAADDGSPDDARQLMRSGVITAAIGVFFLILAVNACKKVRHKAGDGVE